MVPLTSVSPNITRGHFLVHFGLERNGKDFGASAAHFQTDGFSAQCAVQPQSPVRVLIGVVSGQLHADLKIIHVNAAGGPVLLGMAKLVNQP